MKRNQIEIAFIAFLYQLLVPLLTKVFFLRILFLHLLIILLLLKKSSFSFFLKIVSKYNSSKLSPNKSDRLIIRA